MSLSRGRGRITTANGQATIVARCPFCGEEHRYKKGPVAGEEIDEIRKLGFSDEWLPCQGDLPGNFWRIAIVSGRQDGKQRPPRRARGTTAS